MKKIVVLLSLLLISLSYVGSNFFSKRQTLYVYMWSDYIDPDVIEQFQQKHNCWVVVDFYDSNESMYTKLLLGASGYDVAFPSNYFLPLMEQKGLIQKIDPALISNIKYVDTRFVQEKLSLSPSEYAIPYMASFSGLVWRSDRINPPLLTWNLFSEVRLKGRMTLLNDMRETIGIALRALGYSANSESPYEIERAKNLILLSWRPNIAKFESEQYKNGIANGEYILAHGYSGDCLQVMQENDRVRFAYPREGALVSLDYSAILSSSKSSKLAHQFLNFLLDPKIASQNMLFTCSRALNREAKKHLPQHLQASPILYPERDSKVLFECIQPVDSAKKNYNSAWNDIKAGRSRGMILKEICAEDEPISQLH